MNKYQEAIELVNRKLILFDTIDNVEKDEKTRDLIIKTLEEKSREFEWEQSHTKEYLEAQELFNKINGRHEDKEIYEDYALEIYWNDSAYLVTYLDDGQVTIQNRNFPYGDTDYGPDDKEYDEIIKEIVETGLTKIN